jgi:hypothetical protein
MAVCKTVGSAYDGSNPSPATSRTPGHGVANAASGSGCADRRLMDVVEERLSIRPVQGVGPVGSAAVWLRSRCGVADRWLSSMTRGRASGLALVEASSWSRGSGCSRPTSAGRYRVMALRRAVHRMGLVFIAMERCIGSLVAAALVWRHHAHHRSIVFGVQLTGGHLPARRWLRRSKAARQARTPAQPGATSG